MMSRRPFRPQIAWAPTIAAAPASVAGSSTDLLLAAARKEAFSGASTGFLPRRPVVAAVAEAAEAATLETAGLDAGEVGLARAAIDMNSCMLAWSSTWRSGCWAGFQGRQARE